MTPDLPPPRVELHGDFRVQGDIEEVPDVRMRMRPEVHAGKELHVHGIGDLRSEMGDTGFVIVPVAAWGVAETPLGDLHLGRMPIPEWGLGLIANPGGCLNCLSDQTVDRASFTTELVGHVVGVAGDLGPDEIATMTATVGRLPTDLQRRRYLDAGHDIAGYGVWSTWKTRDRDGLGIGLVDGWGRIEHGDMRLEAEGVFVGGRIDRPDSGQASIALPPVHVQQFGGALQAQWRFVDGEVGYASGDSAPGRGVGGVNQVNPPADTAWTNLTVSENHFVDSIQWRRNIGALTDALWIHTGLTVWPTSDLSIRGWFTHSIPQVRTDETLAPEVGTTLIWEAWRGLEMRCDLAHLIGDSTFVRGHLAWVY